MTNEEIFWTECGRWRPRHLELKSWLYRFEWGVHAQALFFALGSMIVFSSAIALDVRYAGADAVPRSGAIIVATALLLAALHLEPKIRNDMDFIQELILAIKKDEMADLPPAKDGEDELVYIFKNTLPAKMAESNLKRGLEKRTELIIRNTYLAELCIAATGTLIWGFGDLLTNVLNT